MEIKTNEANAKSFIRKGYVTYLTPIFTGCIVTVDNDKQIIIITYQNKTIVKIDIVKNTIYMYNPDNVLSENDTLIVLNRLIEFGNKYSFALLMKMYDS
jgi:hypothetical protein